MRKKVLLHACCGPCAEFPLQELMQEDLDIIVYYYNPNIHPYAEWKRRLNQLEKLTEQHGLKLLVEGTSEQDKWLEWEQQGKPDRCRMCYESRISRTGAKAAEIGADAFLSTLQVSPYQNFSLICSIGRRVAETNGIEFMERDFRAGFRAGQKMAREHGLYRQKYCGCIISLENSDFRTKILRDLEGLEAEPELSGNDHK